MLFTFPDEFGPRMCPAKTLSVMTSRRVLHSEHKSHLSMDAICRLIRREGPRTEYTSIG
jgi:hypothetical protein